MRQVAGMHEFKRDAVRVSVAKGIETDTRLRMSEVIRQVCGGVTVVALSGPSHAEEVAVDLPATIVAAGEDETACLQAQEAFHAPAFRVYTSPDIVGVELGGALKNVIAVAAGACDGFGLGDNAKAALITRGLAEIGRLGRAMGAHPLTFAGLSGMGDLIVTCGSRHSRNRALGERLASGMTGEEAIAASKGVAEGARNAQSAQALSEQYRVEMPICRVIYEVLYEGYPIRDAVERLMGRRAKPEAF
jgi:glycerol-3-phosphate dehydrogenase (NAD(P)+)